MKVLSSENINLEINKLINLYTAILSRINYNDLRIKSIASSLKKSKSSHLKNLAILKSKIKSAGLSKDCIYVDFSGDNILDGDSELNTIARCIAPKIETKINRLFNQNFIARAGISKSTIPIFEETNPINLLDNVEHTIYSLNAYTDFPINIAREWYPQNGSGDPKITDGLVVKLDIDFDNVISFNELSIIPIIPVKILDITVLAEDGQEISLLSPDEILEIDYGKTINFPSFNLQTQQITPKLSTVIAHNCIKTNRVSLYLAQQDYIYQETPKYTTLLLEQIANGLLEFRDTYSLIDDIEAYRKVSPDIDNLIKSIDEAISIYSDLTMAINDIDGYEFSGRITYQMALENIGVDFTLRKQLSKYISPTLNFNSSISSFSFDCDYDSPDHITVMDYAKTSIPDVFNILENFNLTVKSMSSNGQSTIIKTVEPISKYLDYTLSQIDGVSCVETNNFLNFGTLLNGIEFPISIGDNLIVPEFVMPVDHAQIIMFSNAPSIYDYNSATSSTGVTKELINYNEVIKFSCSSDLSQSISIPRTRLFNESTAVFSADLIFEKYTVRQKNTSYDLQLYGPSIEIQTQLTNNSGTSIKTVIAPYIKPLVGVTHYTSFDVNAPGIPRSNRSPIGQQTPSPQLLYLDNKLTSKPTLKWSYEEAPSGTESPTLTTFEVYKNNANGSPEFIGSGISQQMEVPSIDVSYLVKTILTSGTKSVEYVSSYATTSKYVVYVLALDQTSNTYRTIYSDEFVNSGTEVPVSIVHNREKLYLNAGTLSTSINVPYHEPDISNDFNSVEITGKGGIISSINMIAGGSENNIIIVPTKFGNKQDVFGSANINGAIKLKSPPYLGTAFYQSIPPNSGLITGPFPVSVSIDNINQDRAEDEYYKQPTVINIVEERLTMLSEGVFKLPHSDIDISTLVLKIYTNLSVASGESFIIVKQINDKTGADKSHVSIPYGAKSDEAISMPMLSNNFIVNYDGTIILTSTLLDSIKGSGKVLASYSYTATNLKNIPNRKIPYTFNITGKNRPLQEFNQASYPVYEFTQYGDNIQFYSQIFGAIRVTYTEFASSMNLTINMKHPNCKIYSYKINPYFEL